MKQVRKLYECFAACVIVIGRSISFLSKFITVLRLDVGNLSREIQRLYESFLAGFPHSILEGKLVCLYLFISSEPND
jgi:hypothetical protein